MKYKLLVAEDEFIERKMLCQTLTKHLSGFCVLLEAENGDEAWKLAKTESPELAILDIEMPGMSGLEVARKIRDAGNPCAILFLTGFDKFSYAKQAITVRALDYLLKPYDEEELIYAVEEAMQAASHFSRRIPLQPIPDESNVLPSPENDENLRISLVRDQIRECIAAHYMEDLSMQEVAQYMRYSEGYFCRLFKQCFHTNFSMYLNQYRIEKAKELLHDPRTNVKEVSIACGYNDSAYFSRVFKRFTGCTPSEYKLSEGEKKRKET